MLSKLRDLHFIFFLLFAIGIQLNGQCPTIEVIMVDACGFEASNEFMIIHSGDGFNTSDLQIDFDFNNNIIGPQNNDIHFNNGNFPPDPTPCSFVAGNAGIISGCDNVISVGLGEDIPPDVYVILQTSSQASFAYDFSTLCGDGGCIYVISNSCPRSAGAFSNSGTGLRETRVLLEGTDCDESAIYDRALVDSNDGAYYGPGIGYGNDGCVVPEALEQISPLPPEFDPIADVESCGNFTLEEISGQNLTGTEAYFTEPEGGGATFPPGSVINFNTTLYVFDPEAPCSDEISFNIEILAPPTANPAGPLESCEDEDGNAFFQLFTLENTVNGGTGNAVSWFFDEDLTQPLDSPENQLITTGSTTVYAIVFDGTCDSESIPVDLIVNPFVEIEDPFDTDQFCSTSGIFGLPAEISGITGNWSGPNVIDNIFDPDGLSGSIELMFSPDPTTQCADIFIKNFEIIEAIVPEFDIVDNLCSSDDPLVLPVESSNNIVGNWSGPGVSDNVFDPTGFSGVVVIDFTPITGLCAEDFSAQITIVPAATPEFSPISSLCNSDDPINLQMTSNNGIDGNWSGNGVTNNTFDPNGLDGFITITFTPEPDNCAISTDLVIEVTPSPVAEASSNSPICEGNSLQLNASGGNIYEWSGPDGFSSNEQNPIIDPVTTNSSGDYTVIVSTGGCSDQTSINVSVTPGFALDSDVLQNVSCAGGNDGIISIDLDGLPAFPFNIDWEAPDGVGISGIGDISDLPAGTYGITITDANGCVGSANLVIDGPDEIFLLCNKINDETAPGAEDGRIDVSVGGGTPNFNISISPEVSPALIDVPEGNYVFDELPPGTYTITIIDDNGCEESCTRSINSAGCPPINITIEDVIDPLCHDSQDGYIEVSVDGGQGDITYNWSPVVSNSNVASNLDGGFYTLVVVDAEGCEAGEDFLVIAPDPVSLICNPTQSSSSPGSQDGTAVITLSGGVGGFTTISYETPSGISPITLQEGDNTLEGLEPGVYSILIADSNGCEDDCTFEITSGDCELDANIIIGTPISCAGASDGELIVIVNDGSNNYQYTWNDPSIGDTSSPTDLSFGSYTVTVLDLDTNCEVVSTFNLDEPELLQINCESEAVSGEGEADGVITINIAGGTPNYTIDWNGPVSGTEELVSGFPAGSLDITGLPEGSYIVQVTDSNGCTTTCQSSVNSADCPIEVSLESNNITCFGDNDGSILASVSNASGTITYNWTGPINISNSQNNPQNLPPGSYNLTVIDQSGCSASAQVLLTSPGELMINCNAVNIEPGQDFGSILVNVDGGSTPYEIRYFGPESGLETTDNAGVTVLDELLEGTYQIVFEDANGCLSDTCEATIEIVDEPCDFDISCEVIQDESVPGASDGIVRVSFFPGNQIVLIELFDQNGPVSNVNGGVGEFFTISSLQAGTYTIIVTDQNDCTATCMFTIGLEDVDCDFEVIVENNSNIQCNGDRTGEVNVFLEGTWTDPTFRIWSSGLFEDRFGVHDSLPAGTYMVTVNDSNGCTAEATFTITQPDPLFVSCNTSGDGTNGRISWTGGTGGIFYEVITPAGDTLTNDTPLGGSFFEFEDLSPGTYTVLIFDENGCSSNPCSFTINQPDCEIAVGLFLVDSISCHGDENASLIAEVTGGTAPLTFNWSGPVNIEDTDNPNNIPAGTYNLIVIDAEDCVAEATIEISEPEPLLLFNCQQVSPTSGPDINDGEASVNISGGVSPYVIIRTGPSSMSTSDPFDGISFFSNNLEPGLHIFELVDANGCTTECEVIIESPEPDCDWSIEIVVINPESCPGVADGSLLIAAPGTDPVTLMWSDGEIGNDRSGLTPGTYTVTATDALGCQDSLDIEIEPGEEIGVDFTIEQPNCAMPEAFLTIVGVNNAQEPFTLIVDDQSFESPDIPLTILLDSDGNPFTVTVEVSDGGNCNNQLEVDIDGFDNLAILPFNLPMINVGDQVDLSSLSFNRDINEVDIRLTFNDSLLCENCTELIFTPPTEGNLTVDITDSLGCFDQLIIPIMFVSEEDQNNVYVPNAFSPNGDNINDTFRPYFNETITLVNVFAVYDRWGNLMYKIEDIPSDATFGWNGRRNGELLDPGIFVYQLSVEKLDGSSEFYAGECNLLR